jgi:hypothetical protein
MTTYSPAVTARASRRSVVIAAGVLVSQAGLVAALANAAPAAAAVTAPAPRVCVFDGGGVIASGDAARTSDGREWVCTDGTLVPVRRYGTGG